MPMHPTAPHKSTKRRILRAPALLLLLLAPIVAYAVTTNFSTGFESAEGYASGVALAGQQGWVGYVNATDLSYTNAGSSGNGVTNGGLSGSGQAAYVGLTPLPPAYNSYVELLRYVDLDPVGSNQPIVNFSAKMKVIDSTNGIYDFFYWNFYNQDGLLLFGLEFNNDPQDIGIVNSTNGVANIGNFNAAVEYALGVSMNFVSNRCSVILNGSTLATNLPITITNSVLNLGSVAVIWQPSSRSGPGNNYMLFDDFRLISSSLGPARPQLRVLTPGGGSAAATLRLTGQDGFRFAVEGSTNLTTWLAVGTNTISGGIANYLDSAATNRSSRFYRARWVP